MENFRKALREVIYISRLTGVTKKKLRVVFSVVLSNLTVLSDILIILYFAKILTALCVDSIAQQNARPSERLR